MPSLFSTIQGAINAAINGDTVLIQPGIYLENINYNGKNIVVGSLTLITGDTSYISSTIIDGNQAGSVVVFQNGETSSAKLIGLTIRNGSNDNGGGIQCAYSSPTIINVIISGNTASSDGGGLSYAHSSPTMINVTIMWKYGFFTWWWNLL